jgi:hypothetical protein
VHPRFPVQLVALLATLLALVACGSSGARGADAGTSADASEDAFDGADDAVQDAVVSDSTAGGPYPSLDAPAYGPDGCLLNATPCTSDSMCCQGYCNQGACANGAHPGDRPFH